MATEPAAGSLVELNAAQRWQLAVYGATALPPALRFYELSPTVSIADLEAALAACRLEEPALDVELVEQEGLWFQTLTEKPIIVDTLEPPSTDTRRVEEAAASLIAARTEADYIEIHPPGIAAIVIPDPRENEPRALLALSVDRYAADGLSFDLLERKLGRALDAGAIRPDSPSSRADRAESFIRTMGPAPVALQADAGPLIEEMVRCSNRPAATDGPAPSPARSLISWPDADDFLLGCREHGISVAMAFIGAEALLTATVAGGDGAVINVPVSNRTTREQRATVGKFSTLIHVPVLVDPDQTLGKFRLGLRTAMLKAIQARRVNPLSVYRELHSRLPFWPPGWNAICNVREGLRWAGCDSIRPLDVPFIEPTDVGARMLSANVRYAESVIEAEWIWDARSWPEGSAESFTELATAIGTTAPTASLSDLAATAWTGPPGQRGVDAESG
jgi:hypothetical protein